MRNVVIFKKPLKIPGDMVFPEVVNDTCCTSLCDLLMMISEYHNLNMDRNRGNAMANILLKN